MPHPDKPSEGIPKTIEMGEGENILTDYVTPRILEHGKLFKHGNLDSKSHATSRSRG